MSEKFVSVSDRGPPLSRSAVQSDKLVEEDSATKNQTLRGTPADLKHQETRPATYPAVYFIVPFGGK